jgi:hypothetical protein
MCIYVYIIINTYTFLTSSYFRLMGTLLPYTGKDIGSGQYGGYWFSRIWPICIILHIYALYTFMYIYKYTYIYTYAYMHIYVCIYIHIYIYINIYIHIYLQLEIVGTVSCVAASKGTSTLSVCTWVYIYIWIYNNVPIYRCIWLYLPFTLV